MMPKTEKNDEEEMPQAGFASVMSEYAAVVLLYLLCSK